MMHKISLSRFLPLNADNSGFFYSSNDFRLNVANIKRDLHLMLNEFFNLNGLSLNFSKTVVIQCTLRIGPETQWCWRGYYLRELRSRKS